MFRHTLTVADTVSNTENLPIPYRIDTPQGFPQGIPVEEFDKPTLVYGIPRKEFDKPGLIYGIPRKEFDKPGLIY
ncbi:MAG: hypothetical protein R3Y36_06975, partial [Spirochaetales bacterium]